MILPRTHCLSYGELTGDEQLYIAIQSAGPGQRHLGIYFKNLFSEKLLHFAWHNQLREETSVEALSQYQFIDVNFLDEDEKSYFIAFLENVYKRNSEVAIAYAPAGSEGQIDEEGVFNSKDGLTCSLFVLSLFESQQYDFIDKEEWPLRDDDRDWQLKILKVLFNYLVEKSLITEADKELIDSQKEKSLRGAPRFRPEEVGAGTTFNDIPNKFTIIQPVSEQILVDIR